MNLFIFYFPMPWIYLFIHLNSKETSVMINFVSTSQDHGKPTQVVGKTLFQGVSVRVLLEDISI